MTGVRASDEVKKIDLLGYLERLGFKPARTQGNDHWFLSPFRDEKTPSFKVNSKLNVWYDHGIGKGGTIIDFGVEFYRCSVADFLQRMQDNNLLPFHPQFVPKKEAGLSGDEKKKIAIVKVEENITSYALLGYLRQRNIDVDIAKIYCTQVTFELYGKQYLAIGFENNSGGFELRNAGFKGSSSPKDFCFFRGHSDKILLNTAEDFPMVAKDILVFEGFTDFLSYQTLQQQKFSSLSNEQPHFLVLNSLAFFKKSQGLMEKHGAVHLYLDHDRAGIKATQQALLSGKKYVDKSLLYKSHKDFNEFLIKEHPKARSSLGIHRRF